jgi:hypothetical protein
LNEVAFLQDAKGCALQLVVSVRALANLVTVSSAPCQVPHFRLFSIFSVPITLPLSNAFAIGFPPFTSHLKHALLVSNIVKAPVLCGMFGRTFRAKLRAAGSVTYIFSAAFAVARLAHERLPGALSGVTCFSAIVVKPSRIPLVSCLLAALG